MNLDSALTFLRENQILSGSAVVVAGALAWSGRWLLNRQKPTPDAPIPVNLDKLKLQTKILFVDDHDFKVVGILKKAGWVNTKKLKDITSLDDAEVKATDIFFIDIQGVGKQMGFADEGGGICSAIKSTYPDKRVVIYSAERHPLHNKLNIADAVLPKNADPYEFMQLLEQLAKNEK